jgi:anti-sigma regulatory factor (Ser/Thr protein kinase)
MSKLDIKFRQASACGQVMLVVLDPVLDNTLASRFSPFWPLIAKKKICRVFLNLEAVKQFSPEAAGFLAGALQVFRLSAKELMVAPGASGLWPALLQLDPGLAGAVLSPGPDEWAQVKAWQQEPALDHFTLLLPPGEIVSGRGFTLRVEARDALDHTVTAYAGIPHLMSNRGMISPTLLPEMQSGAWEGQAVLTAPGEVTLKVWDDLTLGEATVQVREVGEKIAFPVTVACPGCGKPNVVSKPDVSRCVKCNFIYFVDPRGNLVPLKSGLPPGNGFVRDLQFRIPSDINYLNLVRNFISGIAREEGLDDEQISQVEMALDEALANVVEHAYTYDSFQDVEIHLSLRPGELEITVKDQGREFDTRKNPLPNLKEHIEARRMGGLGRYLMTTLMDEVEYRRLHQTNELRMIKRFTTRSDA